MNGALTLIVVAETLLFYFMFERFGYMSSVYGLFNVLHLL